MEELKLWCENLILSVIAILLIELLIPESMENKKYIKLYNNFGTRYIEIMQFDKDAILANYYENN